MSAATSVPLVLKEKTQTSIQNVWKLNKIGQDHLRIMKYLGNLCGLADFLEETCQKPMETRVTVVPPPPPTRCASGVVSPAAPHASDQIFHFLATFTVISGQI